MSYLFAYNYLFAGSMIAIGLLLCALALVEYLSPPDKNRANRSNNRSDDLK